MYIARDSGRGEHECGENQKKRNNITSERRQDEGTDNGCSDDGDALCNSGFGKRG